MSPQLKQDTLPEDPNAVGSAKDVEDLMRKYDKESNTRIWEGTPAVIVRMVHFVQRGGSGKTTDRIFSIAGHHGLPDLSCQQAPCAP